MSVLYTGLTKIREDVTMVTFYPNLEPSDDSEDNPWADDTYPLLIIQLMVLVMVRLSSRMLLTLEQVVTQLSVVRLIMVRYIHSIQLMQVV